jgi:DNA-binding MarR family transcriptional regulator
LRDKVRRVGPRDFDTDDTPTAPPPAQPRAMGPRALRSRDAGTSDSPLGIDRVIHEPLRLGMASALAVHDVLTFVELKARLQTTDGNLSVHARKLETAGYVSSARSFDGRMPRTEYRLTHAGRKALERYLETMEAIIRRARSSEPAS